MEAGGRERNPMIRFVVGFLLGVLITSIVLQQKDLDQVVDSVPSMIDEAGPDFTFYDNLYDTSVTVMEDVYDQALAGQSAVKAPELFFVQLGSFSKKESADGFRAEVILEGYMTSDVRVQSIDGYHRVVLGPFSYKEEAELAMNWANKRLFSSLLIVR